MNILLVLLSLVAVVFLLKLQARGFCSAPRVLRLANLGVSQHVGSFTKRTDAAHALRYLLVKQGTDAAHVAIAGAADIPYGVATDEASAAEELVSVAILGAQDKTLPMVASAAIAADAFVVSAANGKIRTLPVAAGTYYIIGRALEAAGADEDVIEIASCFPIQRVVT